MTQRKAKNLISSTSQQDFSSSTESHQHTSKQLDTQLCRNIYIGLCGPIGVKLRQVREDLELELKNVGYEVITIKISDLFDEFLPPDYNEPDLNDCKSVLYERYRVKQHKGNYLRKLARDNAILASLAINKISIKRVEGVPNEQKKERSLEFSKKKIAFIIDQLKRPEEIELLKRVYKNLFFLYAVVETRDSRITNLSDSREELEHEAISLIERDKHEGDLWGQEVLKTVLESDFFHNNNGFNRGSNTDRISRFVKLIHGVNGMSPTQEEFGMFQAHTASLGSLCLSRQVGAAILDKSGNVLAVGRNDVPKFGGGLYESVLNENSVEDKRCALDGDKICYNDKYKNEIIDKVNKKIGEIVSEHLDDKKIDYTSKAALVSDLTNHVKNNPDIKSIIEYSRAVHAEMDAIVSVARKGIKLGKSSTLYPPVAKKIQRKCVSVSNSRSKSTLALISGMHPG